MAATLLANVSVKRETCQLFLYSRERLDAKIGLEEILHLNYQLKVNNVKCGIMVTDQNKSTGLLGYKVIQSVTTKSPAKIRVVKSDHH